MSLFNQFTPLETREIARFVNLHLRTFININLSAVDRRFSFPLFVMSFKMALGVIRLSDWVTIHGRM